MGWLDLGEEDQKRAKNYLADFRTEDTVDELGFGIMRDALAEQFFPATNTVMTRARYLIFVPALYLKVESERLNGARASARMINLENRLRVALDRPEVDGVIGRRAKEDLARFPSNVYWNSLKRLRIFLRSTWSQSYYHDHLQQFYEESTPVRDDDGLGHLSSDEVGNWDKRFGDFFKVESSIVWDALEAGRLDFDLRLIEAQYLTDRFGKLPGNQSSLLSHLISLRYADEFAYPWDVPCPESMRDVVSHAKHLSMFAKGATLLYYQMLVDARAASGLESPDHDWAKPFSLWWTGARKELVAWDVEDFFRLMHRLRAVRQDREFFEHWLSAIKTATTPSALFNGQQARDWIRGRERAKRSGKARLAGGDRLRSWKLPSMDKLAFVDPMHVRYSLDYRSAIGGAIVRDITRGLARKK